MKRFQINRRKTLIIILIALLLLLGVLTYLYFILTRPEARSSTKAKGFKHIFSIYGYGEDGDRLLLKPNGIAVSNNGNLYVADQGNHQILVFDKNGKYLFKFGKEGTKKGELQSPMGIAVSSFGQVYVTDRVQNKVLIFDSDGKFIKEFKVKEPLTPAIGNDRLYLTTGSSVLIYNLDGKRLAKWGKRGKEKGDFDFPNGITVGGNGNVYVADSNNLRIQALNRQGEVLWTAGKPPEDAKDKSRKFGLPVSIAVDEDNVIYVVDAFPGSIKVFNKNGEQLEELGEFGTKDGQLNHPAQIVYAGNRIFFVADKYNDRVQAIDIPKFKNKD